MFKYPRKTLLNLILVAGGIVLALTLLEIQARIFLNMDNTAEQETFICSTQLGWRGNPAYAATVKTDGYEHSISHNSVGMHDEEHPLPKPENTLRILMLGDSFTRAGHVNEAETVHQIVENLLNEKGKSKNFEMINAAMTGWGTGQELIYYRNEGQLYQPDIVILMFYIGNDGIDNLPGNVLTIGGKNCYAPYFAICNDQLDTTPWLYAPGLSPAMNQCLLGRKMLTNTLGRVYSFSQLYTKLEPLLMKNASRFNKLPYYPFYIPQEHELYDYAWNLTIALIKQLHQDVTKNGSDFAVVLIGPADVINFSGASPDVLETIYQKIPETRDMEFDRPYTKLTEILNQEGIKSLNLQPLFIQHSQETREDLHFSRDKHWNVEGHQFAANAIFEWMSAPDNFHLEQ